MTAVEIRKVGDDYSHYQHGVQISAMCYALADVVEAGNELCLKADERPRLFQALARLEALTP